MVNRQYKEIYNKQNNRKFGSNNILTKTIEQMNALLEDEEFVNSLILLEERENAQEESVKNQIKKADKKSTAKRSAEISAQDKQSVNKEIVEKQSKNTQLKQSLNKKNKINLWDWKKHSEETEQPYKDYFKTEFERISEQHTPVAIQTKNGIQYKSTYQKRKEELDYIDNEVERVYGPKINPLQSTLNSLENYKKSVRDSKGSYSAIGGAMNQSITKDNPFKNIDEQAIRSQLEDLQLEKEAYRQQLKNEIDPNSNIAEIFKTFQADINFHPEFALKIQEARNARETFESLKQQKEQDFIKASPSSIFDLNDNRKQVIDYYKPLLKQAAERELNAVRAVAKEQNDYRTLDQWIRVNGWPTNPKLLPEHIRKIAEKVLPGSTTEEVSTQLINSQYVGDKDLIRDKILNRLQQESQKGINIDLSKELLQSAIDDLLHKREIVESVVDYKDYAKYGVDESGNNSIYDLALKEVDKNYNLYGEALDVLKRAKKDWELNEEAKKGSWTDFNPFDNKRNTMLIGAERAVTRMGFWDQGLSDLKDALLTKQVADKIKSGQQLTEGEQSYLNALSINEIIQQNHTDALTTGGAMAGEVATNSAMFVAQFILSKGILGATKTAGKGIVSKAAKFILGETGDNMMKKVALEGVKKYGVNGLEAKVLMAGLKTPGFLTKVAGDITYSAMLSNTLLAAKTASDAINLHTGNVAYETDEEGKIIGTGFSGGQNWNKAIYTSEARQFTENFSEMMGEWGIGTLLGKMAKHTVLPSFVKLVGKRNAAAMRKSGQTWMENARRGIQNTSTGKLMKYAADALKGNHKWKEFMKSGQYHGFFGEMSEEYYGMALQHLLGVSDSNNSFWEDITDKQQFWDIFGGIALSSAVMGIGSQIHYGYQASRFRSAEKRAKETFGDNWAGIERAILFANDKNIGNVMSRIENTLKTTKEKEVLLDYYNRLMGYRGVSMLEQKLAEDRNETAHLRSVRDAQLSGYMTGTLRARNDINRAIEITDERLSEEYGVSEEGAFSMQEYIDLFGGVESFILTRPELSTELKNRLYAFDNMIAARDGMSLRAVDNVDNMLQEQYRLINRISHKNGNVIYAIDDEGKHVFVVEGNVLSNKEGEIDLENSDKQIKIADQNGDIKIINIEDLRKIESKKSANVLKSEIGVNVYKAMSTLDTINEKKLGIKIGDQHDLGDGRKLTVLESTRDGGILYSISDEKSETVGHKSSVGEMQQLIDEINNGRIEKIIERAIEQSKDDGIDIEETYLITELNAQDQLLNAAEQRRNETEENYVASYIPSSSKSKTKRTSNDLFKTINKIANSKDYSISEQIDSNIQFELFKQRLENEDIQVDNKYDGRLQLLFKALQKGEITSLELASVFISTEDRKKISSKSLEENEINIDDDGNVIKPRKKYISPIVKEQGNINTRVIVSAPEASIQGSIESVNNIQETELQKSTYDLLMKHLCDTDSEYVGRTGKVYFFKIDGNIVMFSRVHSVLDPQYVFEEGGKLYSESGAERNKKSIILKELSKEYESGGLENVKKYIEHNEKYYEDLNLYIEYLKQNPEDIQIVFENIASEFARTDPGKSVDYGQLIDEITRRFFEGEELTYDTILNDNRPVLNGKSISQFMPKDVFDDIIGLKTNDKPLRGLNLLKTTYETFGWKVSYAPHKFYMLLPNGTNIAGETDCIAVDLDGNVFVIDTKTSYKVYTNTLDKSNRLFLINPYRSRNGGQQVRSLGDFYTDQLTMYAEMINEAIGSDVVKGIILTPWHLSYQTRSVDMSLEEALNDPLMINLAINKDLMSRYMPINAAKESENELNNAKQELYDLSQSLREILLTIPINFGDLEQLSSSINFTIDELKRRIQNILDTYETALSIYDCLMYLNAILKIIDDYAEAEYLANMYRDEFARIKSEEESAKSSELTQPKSVSNDDIDENPPSVAVQINDNPYTASTFNNSSGDSIGISDAVAEDDSSIKLSSVTGYPDFIDNAQFKFIMKTVKNANGQINNKVHVVVTYNGHKFTPVAITFANKNFYNRIKNLCENSGNRSVVPIKVERSSGEMISSSPRSVIDSGLISMDKNGTGMYIYDITYSDGQDVFGVTKTYDTPSGKITQAECQGMILHIYSEKQRIRNSEKTGSKGMPAGSIIMMVDRNFEEIKRQGQRVRVPVTLQNSHITEDEANLIVDILSGKHGHLDAPYTEIGKPSLGISNRDVINLLIPTQVDTESPNVPLHLEIDEKYDMSYGNTVIRSITVSGNIAGTEITELNPFIAYPNDEKSMSNLFNLLQFVNKNIDLLTASIRLGTANNIANVPSSHPFAKIASVVRSSNGKRTFDHGPIQIGNTSIVFDKSDFNDPNDVNDQQGLSGLGWYIKHGFVNTKFAGFLNSLLSFDENAGVRLENKKENKPTSINTINSKEIESVSEIVSKRKSEIQELEELMRKAGLNDIQINISEKPLNEKLARKRLEDIFGKNGVPVEFVDHAIAVLKNGANVVGRCYADAILLSRDAEQGVEWHEAFHRVVELLLSDKERTSVYKSFRNSKVGNKNMTDKQVAEGLADGFRYYMENKPTFKLTWNIKKLYRQAKDWIGFLSNIGSIRLYKLYSLTNRGRFRNVMPTDEAVERMKKFAENGLNYTVNNTEFENILHITQLKDLIHSLVFLFVNPDTQDINFSDGSGTDSLKTDVETLKSSKVYLTWLLEIPKNNPTHKLLVEIVDKYDAIKPLVDSAIREFITDYVQQEESKNDSLKVGEDTESKDPIETTSEQDTKSAGIGEHTKASWETSLFARSSDKVRFFFSGIDSGKRNSLGLPEVYPVRYVFSSVLNEVHDCKSPEDLIKKLSNLGIQIPMFTEVAKRMLMLYNTAWGSVSNKKLLDADREALLTQIYNVLKASKCTFKIIKNYRNGLRWYQTIESTDLRYIAKRHVSDWSRQFAAGASKYVKLDHFGKLVMKGKFSPLVFRRLYYFIAGRTIDPNIPESMYGLIYAFSDFSRSKNAAKFKVNGKDVDVYTEEGLEIAKDQFVSFLNSLGITFDRETLDYMLLHKYGNVGTEGMRKMLSSNGTDSVEAFARLLNGMYKQQRDQQGNIIKTILNVDESGKTINGKPIRKIFNDSGFVIELANWKYQYDHAHTQLNVIGTGGNKMYVMSENNTIIDRIDELETEEFVTKLSGIKYINSEGRGSRIFKHVSSNGHKKLQFIIHSGLKTDNIGDQGIDYDTINNREDYISKLTVLLAGHVLLPTMSDKKTYGWIEGCNTAGIDWNKSSLLCSDIFGKNEKGELKKPEFDGNGDYIIPVKDEVLDQLLEYADTEKDHIEYVLDNYKKHKKVNNFHSGSTIKTKDGSYKTINGARFTGLLGVYDENGNYISFNRTIDEDGNYLDEEANLIIANKYFFSKTTNEKKQMLSKLILMLTRRELKDAENLGLIEKIYEDSIDPFRSYRNVGLDSKKIQIVSNAIQSTIPAEQRTNDVLNNIESLALATVLQDAVVKSMQSIQEFERIFSGNPGFYKMKWNKNGKLIDRTTDQFKRLGGLVSTGTNNNLSIPGIDPNAEYTCAELKDEMIQSPAIDDILRLMMSGELKKTYLKHITSGLVQFDKNLKPDSKFDFGEGFGVMSIYELEDKINEMSTQELEESLSKTENGKKALEISKRIAQHKIDQFKKDEDHEGINVTDGASYISDTMCENLLRMCGSYGKDVLKAFKILRGEKVDGRVYTVKDTVELSEAYHLIRTKVIGIQKYTAYGFRFQDGLAVPYYNKTALFPVFKNISTGGMANIYEAMHKQNIDMLMMDSAVKLGGQESKKMDWELCKNGEFKFNTYKLKYAYIRKQFNTDPKEKKLMQMGTQMTKVAMSLLTAARSFNVRGERMSSEQLRDDIMDCMRKLSSNGEQKLRKKFFRNGELDVKKFSKLLTEELSQRGASIQQLDAVKSVLRGSGNNKKLQLNIPLAAQSAVNWIQSILVSMINKLTIDVNTPGEAFYQRSVWGMEGPTNVIGDENLPQSINDGRTLKMINEEGSMDCVLSIDFFELILKNANINDLSFEEQRKWLIDHNIIGGPKYDKNDLIIEGTGAKANIIGYRIPTQAISSIHPLRCVDVLPATVNHTVILPAEFTKITGSDKQYQCSNLYNIKNPFNCWEVF